MSNMYNKILVTTDGSEYSLNSFKHALSIAKDNGAEIIVLTVMDTGFVVEIPSPDIIREVRENLNSKSDENLIGFEKLAKELGYDVKINLCKKQGSPAKVILKTIEEENIDLVVIGSSGKSGFDKFIVGSVANKIVNSAKCSVLVIKE